ncbi:MAG TPA: hypothetical protein DCG57_18895 [Candidatus Riflebacteria bacterium]|nr:hypothetical protein [Candidatus Riflebacteria bacterium]
MASTEDKTKRKRNWQAEEEEGLEPWQKAVIIALATFIPFMLFVVAPMIARDHYSKTLKLPEEVFLKAPEEINLVSTGEVGDTYKVLLNETEFKIPESFTPTKISRDRIDFKPSSRREARQIIILAQKESRTIQFTNTGFARWFMPSSMQLYLQTILRATWHPIYLLFKAQFFASEGITGRIFEARWDVHHRGFIFPVSGGKGYIGRVFRTNNPGYFEFMVLDSVAPVSLREWVNLAMRIKPPSDLASATLPASYGNNSIEALIERAALPEREPEVLSTALTLFYHQWLPGWLLPVATVMENREFFAELIELHQQFANSFEPDSPYKVLWDQLFNRALNKIIKLEIDPQLHLRELSVNCLNLTHLEITQVWLKITIKSRISGNKSFMAELLPHGRLYEQQAKDITIRAPDNISLADAESVDYQITRLSFSR